MCIAEPIPDPRLKKYPKHQKFSFRRAVHFETKTPDKKHTHKKKKKEQKEQKRTKKDKKGTKKNKKEQKRTTENPHK